MDVADTIRASGTGALTVTAGGMATLGGLATENQAIQVTSDKLLLALKAADDALKEKIFKNMSQRAAEMLREDLASRGPVKLSEVEGAQKEILVIARKLAEEGSINLGSKGGGEAYV